ncbi:MAG: GGDEF domain-containing protein [Firmicutes bacterium HGW-Firmicutes-15]|nr:MAG: GGDEF domain-containing protein [Firmicutes bacterium HGW-Firmicutes-15]
MKELVELIEANQTFLIRRTLEYAKLHNYTKYTSTLEEAWQVSINGLTEALLSALRYYGLVPELNVDEDYSTDRIGIFGVLEAQLHRSRGVTLEMFLGLMKYYRQSYLDLVMEANWDKNIERKYLLFINRFFDRVELAFCSEWTRDTKEVLFQNLQDTNRTIINEKNKYLTIFESIPTPAIILDSDNMIDNMNKAAIDFLKYTGIMGTSYYSGNRNVKNVSQLLPWLVEEFNSFIEGSDIEATIEKNLELFGMEARNVVIKFHRMLDVSERYKGTVIILTDLTYRKQIEDKLRFISFHDDFTGLYNRAFFQEELIRLDSGRFDPVAIIVCDVDGLKVVNDTLGHQAGDILLKTTAAILCQSFREGDVAARVGGDEFAIALPSSSPEGLEESCERIRTALAKHNTENPMVPLSFSIGAALGDTRNISIGEIYRNADFEMYLEKPDNREKYRLLFSSLYAMYGNKLFR